MLYQPTVDVGNSLECVCFPASGKELLKASSLLPGLITVKISEVLDGVGFV